MGTESKSWYVMYLVRDTLDYLKMSPSPSPSGSRMMSLTCSQTYPGFRKRGLNGHSLRCPYCDYTNGLDRR